MFRTRMLHARSRWGAWGAGPILSAASFSHSPGRSPAHPGRVEATAPVAVALSDVVRGVPVSARLLSCGGTAHGGRHHPGPAVPPQRAPERKSGGAGKGVSDPGDLG